MSFHPFVAHSTGLGASRLPLKDSPPRLPADCARRMRRDFILGDDGREADNVMPPHRRMARACAGPNMSRAGQRLGARHVRSTWT